jgi:outer membrane protein TolC
MELPCLKFASRAFCGLALVTIFASAVWAQTNQSAPMPQAPSASQTPTAPPKPFVVGEYAKGRSHFPNPIGPYTSRSVPSPNLTNTPRLDQLLKNGKLMLSMNDAIALALENNLDIAISRYNLHIADTDVLRTKAGAALLGVNTGVVQGTPGGGVGGFGGATTATGGGAGGTTGGGGGAGSGTLGIVSSTLGLGSPVLSYDPILTGTIQLDRNTVLGSNPFTTPVTRQDTNTYDFGYQQGFVTGTNLSVGFNNSRTSTNSTFSTFSPQLNSNFRAQITQHLLQGFGFVPNERFIIIARNNRELTDVAFRLQIITTVDQIQNMYWDLVNAYENVKVQQDALALADKTLSDNKKQVEIGTLAPIEIVRAQSTVATSQQALIVAKTSLELQQLLMKNALSRTVQDPALIDAEVIPTDTMSASTDQEATPPGQDLVNDALSHRPELAESRIDLKSREVSMKAVKNSLLPSIDLFAYYGGSGLGGSANPANLCANQNPPNFGCSGPPGTIPVVPTTGYGGTLNQLVNSTAPDKGAGISINIPIRNRTAQANQIRSQLEYRQAQMRLQQVENEVRIEVRNAQFALQQNKASVAAAQAAVDLAQQSLDAEQKKYALGASTSTLVLQQSSALTQSRSNLVAARAAYEKARVELDRATGLLLERNGIDLADAQSGVVNKLPAVPYVAPRTDLQTVGAPQTQTAPQNSITPEPAPQASPPTQAPQN